MSEPIPSDEERAILDYLEARKSEGYARSALIPLANAAHHNYLGVQRTPSDEYRRELDVLLAPATYRQERVSRTLDSSISLLHFLLSDASTACIVESFGQVTSDASKSTLDEVILSLIRKATAVRLRRSEDTRAGAKRIKNAYRQLKAEFLKVK